MISQKIRPKRQKLSKISWSPHDRTLGSRILVVSSWSCIVFWPFEITKNDTRCLTGRIKKRDFRFVTSLCQFSRGASQLHVALKIINFCWELLELGSKLWSVFSPTISPKMSVFSSQTGKHVTSFVFQNKLHFIVFFEKSRFTLLGVAPKVLNRNW